MSKKKKINNYKIKCKNCKWFIERKTAHNFQTLDGYLCDGWCCRFPKQDLTCKNNFCGEFKLT